MKIDRALIIRRLGVESSIEYANMCAESCEKHDLNYEFIDGIEFMSSDEAFNAVGVWKRPEYIGTTGHNNCHASHIKAWKRIIELEKACLILEHDAVVMGNVKNIDIPDMAAITFGHRIGTLNRYKPIGPITSLVQLPKTIGVHACGLTPVTATYLYEDAYKNGVGENVDKFLFMEGSSGLNIYATDPPQVVCWPRFSTREFVDQEKRTGTMGSTWNYTDGVAPSWKLGIR